MKSILFSTLVLWALAARLPAALVLDEPFNYPDGSLVLVSGGAWETHNGGAGELLVVNGTAEVRQDQREDVNRPLSGQPYTNGVLYLSCVVEFTELPLSTPGTYFLHFKAERSTFRAKVFVTTEGAGENRFRLGIANGFNTQVTYVPSDLAPNTAYTVVVRYNVETAQSTLWINPTSEETMVNRADGVDAPDPVEIVAVALRESNASGGMGVVRVDDLKVGTTFEDVVSVGGPPTISGIADQSIPANTSTGPIPFTVDDAETPAAELTLSATSSNPGLVPEANIVFGGSGTDRTVTVTPAADQEGRATITVTVQDGDGLTAESRFEVIVGAPSISPVPDQFTYVEVPTAPIPFTVSDHESPPEALVVTATSSDQGLVEDAAITLEGTGAERTATIMPALGASGLVTITLSVSDGTHTVSTSFVLSISPNTGLDLVESFDYPNGSLITNSGFVWNTHSGTSGETQVIDGRVELTGAQSEDVHVFLNNSPYVREAGYVLYAGWTLNVSELSRDRTGVYFAHFRDIGFGFRGRVFVTTNGAAAGRFRLGVANASFEPTAVLPVDLAPGVDYAVVIRYVVGTGQTTLWVDPATESDPSVTAPDVVVDRIDVWTFALRQSRRLGTLQVDDLKISTAFADVVTPKIKLRIAAVPDGVRLSWPASAQGYVLQSTDAVPGGAWTDSTAHVTVEGDENVVRLPATDGQRFFRLIQR